MKERLKQWLSESRESLRQKPTAFSEWADTPDGKAQSGRLLSVLGFIAVLALIGVSIAALYYFPSWYVNQSVGPQVLKAPVRAFELENETRKTLTQIILGIFGLLVLYFTWRRVKAGDKTAAVAEQGHLTDRYTKAIEQLGKLENGQPNIEVRLGGIYALERIAYDSPRDHQTIMEVLCAYIRRNAVPLSAPFLTEPPTAEPSDDAPPSIEKLRFDIQAVLTVISRRQRGFRREKKPFRIDLSGTDLSGADLSEAHLERADLNEAHLGGAILYRAHLEGADLSHAYLERASLNSAHLEGANLSNADLEGARLITANLEMADLSGANLDQAVFYKAQMEGADLSGANLNRAILFNAHLERAVLSGAILDRAHLGGAHLEGALKLNIDQVKSAKDWESAHYSPDFRRELGLPDPPA
ncbi:MAG: pentapeptide repeat-containing protein [Bryobacteraceae bacterium]|nr:pentapeptide repeat-containing protein [Bryobacteraceae bacterium]